MQGSGGSRLLGGSRLTLCRIAHDRRAATHTSATAWPSQKGSTRHAKLLERRAVLHVARGTAGPVLTTRPITPATPLPVLISFCRSFPCL